MVETILMIPLILGFLITLFLTPLWIKRAEKANITGKDLHKVKKNLVSEGGGITLLLGFVLGVLIYIAIKTFILKSDVITVEIFALLTTVLIAGFVGFIDDILEWRLGLGKRTRLILLLFASIPLMVINAGQSEMMGINLGLLYPLFFIPLGVIGVSATFNFIAGYNGLETSQGIILLSSLALVTWLTGNSWLSLISLIMVSCLIGFYVFNKHPANVFPGDVLTYSVGALVAIMAILGNIEKIALFFFIPYIIETGLKVRGGLRKESLAMVNNDGSLDMPYKKFYGLEHVAIYLLKKSKKSKKVYEQEVVY
ncbi:MAG TPA: glycosyl transferase family 4, partial [Candidatus Pacearchaeota archaeon]|nr:glycosyl transferase family 4 [Candidatus Pacearchaeota archaeon]